MVPMLIGRAADLKFAQRSILQDGWEGRLALGAEALQANQGLIVDREKIHRRARNSNCALEFCRPRLAHPARNINNGEAPVKTYTFHNIVSITDVASLALVGMTPRCSPQRALRSLD